MSKRRKYLAVALVFGVVVSGSLVFALADTGQPAAFPFRSVTPAELATGGVRVSAATPPANLPTTAAEAVAAEREILGRHPLEVPYAHCADSMTARKLDHECWAVSIDTHGMAVPSQGPMKIRWGLVFVDPGTGKVIEARLG
jgi:hypothetical protein